MSESMLIEVRDRLLQLGRREWPAIAEASGVPISTLEKLAYQVHDDAKFTTVEKLHRALNAPSVS